MLNIKMIDKWSHLALNWYGDKTCIYVQLIYENVETKKNALKYKKMNGRGKKQNSIQIIQF